MIKKIFRKYEQASKVIILIVNLFFYKTLNLFKVAYVTSLRRKRQGSLDRELLARYGITFKTLVER